MVLCKGPLSRSYRPLPTTRASFSPTSLKAKKKTKKKKKTDATGVHASSQCTFIKIHIVKCRRLAQVSVGEVRRCSFEVVCRPSMSRPTLKLWCLVLTSHVPGILQRIKGRKKMHAVCRGGGEGHLGRAKLTRGPVIRSHRLASALLQSPGVFGGAGYNWCTLQKQSKLL